MMTRLTAGPKALIDLRILFVLPTAGPVISLGSFLKRSESRFIIVAQKVPTRRGRKELPYARQLQTDWPLSPRRTHHQLRYRGLWQRIGSTACLPVWGLAQSESG